MNYDPVLEKIKCHICNRLLDPRKDTLQPFGTDDVLCRHCITHLGFTWDLPEFFQASQDEDPRTDSRR